MGMRQIFAENLQAKRAMLGKNQEAFAEELEISRSELQKYLNGTGNPTIDKIEQIAEKIEMEPMDLLFTPMNPERFGAEELLLQINKTIQALDPKQRGVLAAGLAEIIRCLEAEQ